MLSKQKSIQTAAQNMITRYGDNVLNEIEQRIAELLAGDQMDAYELWNEIYETVKFITENTDNTTSH